MSKALRNFKAALNKEASPDYTTDYFLRRLDILFDDLGSSVDENGKPFVAKYVPEDVRALADKMSSKAVRLKLEAARLNDVSRALSGVEMSVPALRAIIRQSISKLNQVQR